MLQIRTQAEFDALETLTNEERATRLKECSPISHAAIIAQLRHRQKCRETNQTIPLYYRHIEDEEYAAPTSITDFDEELCIKDYSNFKELIRGGHNLGKEVYYISIVEHRDEILMDIAKSNQITIAKALNLTQSKLSSILEILKVL